MYPTRRDFLKQMGVAGLALGSPLMLNADEDRASPPNVVLIFIDDLGYGDVGVYGAQGFETPHLDRLAAQGMRFTDFYASQAVCSASRASLLTGCYAERVSIRGALSPNAEVGLHPDETTIAEMLKKRGYATCISGKWHLGHQKEFLPLQHGFDEYLGLPYSNDMWPVNYDGHAVMEGHKAQYPPLPLIEGNECVEYIQTLEDQDTLTSRYTEHAVRFIEKNRKKPFFVYLAHSMPHVPLGVGPDFRGKSEQGMFGDVISEIDGSVGRIMAALKKWDLEDNTLVIFTSDNGPWLNYGNHAGSTGGLREGKGTAFEGGPRVPAIMRWPGRIPVGSTCEKMASTIDVLPTIAAICSAPMPEKPIDGVNILPLLEGDQDANPRNVFFFYYTGELRGVRQGRWKRVYSHKTRSYAGVEPGMDGHPGPYAHPVVPDALYDLESDPAETTDVAAEHPEIVTLLDRLAEKARKSLGDRLTRRTGEEVRPPGRRGFKRASKVKNLATGTSLTLSCPPSPKYPGQGPDTLINGKLSSRDFHDPEWMGFEKDDLEAEIDLGKVMEVKSVTGHFLQDQSSWIFRPANVRVSVSKDGREYQELKENRKPVKSDYSSKVVKVKTRVEQKEVRYIRVHAQNVGECPKWHIGSGGKAWIFCDEIVVQ